MRPSALLPLALDLVQERNVLIELHEAEEGDEAIHDLLLKVLLDAEGALNDCNVKDLLFLLGVRCILHHLYREGILIRIVIQVDEAVVEEEARVALLTVGVVYLLTALDVFKRFNDEALAVISVRPASLPGALVIEHVSIRDKAVSFYSINVNAKDATSDHHANF